MQVENRIDELKPLLAPETLAKIEQYSMTNLIQKKDSGEGLIVRYVGVRNQDPAEAIQELADSIEMVNKKYEIKGSLKGGVGLEIKLADGERITVAYLAFSLEDSAKIDEDIKAGSSQFMNEMGELS